MIIFRKNSRIFQKKLKAFKNILLSKFSRKRVASGSNFWISRRKLWTYGLGELFFRPNPLQKYGKNSNQPFLRAGLGQFGRARVNFICFSQIGSKNKSSALFAGCHSKKPKIDLKKAEKKRQTNAVLSVDFVCFFAKVVFWLLKFFKLDNLEQV